MIVIKNVLNLHHVGRAGDQRFVIQVSLHSTEIAHLNVKLPYLGLSKGQWFKSYTFQVIFDPLKWFRVAIT